AFDLAGLKYPDRDQVLHVVGAYLIKRVVAPAVVSPEICRPILRLFAGIHQPVAGHILGMFLRGGNSYQTDERNNQAERAEASSTKFRRCQIKCHCERSFISDARSKI